VTKLFLDTNIWIRFFAEDVVEQFQAVSDLLSQIETGEFRAYTSSIVLLEVNFILTNNYKLPKEEVLQALDAIMSVRGITVVEKTNIKAALKTHAEINIKLADCIIASQLPKNSILVTFDKEFKKIKDIKANTPEQILANKKS